MILGLSTSSSMDHGVLYETDPVVYGARESFSHIVKIHDLVTYTGSGSRYKQTHPNWIQWSLAADLLAVIRSCY